MIGKSTIQAIAKGLKIDPTELETALSGDSEVDLTIPDVNAYTDDELAKRDERIKQTGYSEGTKAGVEMAVKDIKKAEGWDIPGKDVASIVEYAKTHALETAGTHPDARVKELEEKVAKLTETNKHLEQTAKDSEGKVSQAELRAELHMNMPEGVPVDLDELLVGMQKRGFSFERDTNGKPVAKKDGVTETDKDGTPKPISDVLKAYTSERWKPAPEPEQPKGRAGGSSKGSVAHLTDKAFTKDWIAQGKSTQSADYQTAMTQASKEVGEGFFTE